ncbi:Transcriptional regulator [Puccinia graminis f. sp. tritici]|uniref:Transcriptional regulator n=1 Tax=Puccinia graminis f. sp. tritici TaxID=56615 RepID=A0A5B0RJQ2_PUCGR|nr:Transcriptional regulator [Puccinia graminis f. sp. tritici]KAA1125927.1 Transcriptional regulator [Puccinia graminis f. sp. tritici]
MNPKEQQQLNSIRTATQTIINRPTTIIINNNNNNSNNNNSNEIPKLNELQALLNQLNQRKLDIDKLNQTLQQQQQQQQQKKPQKLKLIHHSPEQKLRIKSARIKSESSLSPQDEFKHHHHQPISPSSSSTTSSSLLPTKIEQSSAEYSKSITPIKRKKSLLSKNKRKRVGSQVILSGSERADSPETPQPTISQPNNNHSYQHQISAPSPTPSIDCPSALLQQPPLPKLPPPPLPPSRPPPLPPQSTTTNHNHNSLVFPPLPPLPPPPLPTSHHHQPIPPVHLSPPPLPSQPPLPPPSLSSSPPIITPQSTQPRSPLHQPPLESILFSPPSASLISQPLPPPPLPQSSPPPPTSASPIIKPEPFELSSETHQQLFSPPAPAPLPTRLLPEPSLSPDSLPLALVAPSHTLPPPIASSQPPLPSVNGFSSTLPDLLPPSSSSFFVDPPTGKAKEKESSSSRTRKVAPPRLIFGLPNNINNISQSSIGHLNGGGQSTPKTAFNPGLGLPTGSLPSGVTQRGWNGQASSTTTTTAVGGAATAEDYTVPIDPIFNVPLPAPISVPHGYPKTQGEVNQDFSKTKPPSSQVPIHQFQNWINDHYLRSFGEDDLAFLASEYSSINGCPTVRVHLPSSPSSSKQKDNHHQGETNGEDEHQKEQQQRDATYDLPPLGRHYSELWRDEDLGLIEPSEKPTPGAGSGRGGGSGPRLSGSSRADLALHNLGTENVQLGPFTERLLGSIIPPPPLPSSVHLSNHIPGPTAATLQPNPPQTHPLDHLELEQRVASELGLLGILPENGANEWKEEEAEDDEISRILRRTQSVLRSQTKINQARKAIVQKIVKERMSVQEFETIKDGLDRLLVQLMIKKNALLNASFRIPSVHQTGSANHLKKEKEKSGRNHLKIKLTTTPSSSSTTTSTNPANHSDNHSTLHPSDHPNNNQLTVLENKIKKCDQSIALTLHKRRMFIMKVAPLLVHQSSSSSHHHHLDGQGEAGEMGDVGRMVSRIHALPESSVYADLDLMLHQDQSSLPRHPIPEPTPNNTNQNLNSHPLNPPNPNHNHQHDSLKTRIPPNPHPNPSHHFNHRNHTHPITTTSNHHLLFGIDADKLIIDHLDPSRTRFLI